MGDEMQPNDPSSSNNPADPPPANVPPGPPPLKSGQPTPEGEPPQLPSDKSSSAVDDLIAKFKALPPIAQILIPVALGSGILLFVCCGGCLVFFGGDKKNDSGDVDESLSAQKLFTDYEANEVAADNKYKGKVLEVSGTVHEISKDAFDNVYVSLDEGQAFNIGRVQCYLDRDSSKKSAELRKGQRVTIRGKCDGMLLGHVRLKSSSLVD